MGVGESVGWSESVWWLVDERIESGYKGQGINQHFLLERHIEETYVYGDLFVHPIILLLLRSRNGCQRKTLRAEMRCKKGGFQGLLRLEAILLTWGREMSNMFCMLYHVTQSGRTGTQFVHQTDRLTGLGIQG